MALHILNDAGVAAFKEARRQQKMVPKNQGTTEGRRLPQVLGSGSYEGFTFSGSVERAYGVHDPPLVLDEYQGPYFGTALTGNQVEIDYLSSVIPVDSWIYYRRIGSVVYGSLFECPDPEL